MTRTVPRRRHRLPLLFTLLFVLPAFFLGTARAQSILPFAEGPSPLEALAPRAPNFFDPSTWFVFLPAFRGEAKVKPLFIYLSGDVQDTRTGSTYRSADVLGMPKHLVVVETMLRGQISPFSFRVHYDAYLNQFRGSRAKLDWPEWRLGMDFDLIDRGAIRLGLNLDVCPQHPEAGISPPQIGNFEYTFPRPVTGGIHCIWNPMDVSGMSLSLEARARRSLRTGTRIDEIDLAAGIKSAGTILGRVAVRGGWRYTMIGLDTSDYEIRSRWSSVFGELVYYY